jgi:signal-transduction protein with cAMP-binding, CBS, and nucleotidyltransferase domain
MRESLCSSVVVATPEGHPIGILTEQDVVRRVAFLSPASTPVSEVMTSPLHIIHDDDYLFHGIALMRRLGLRQLPVINREGRLSGILHLHDALAGAVNRVVDLIERLTHEETPEGLKRVKGAGVEVADALLRDGVPAVEIQKLLTHINNDIYRRVQSMVLQELIQEGWGQPPVEFDLIVMGSGGRGESFLNPDQDSGIILTDYPDTRHTVVDTYFIEVSRRMSLLLDAVGIPACRGYVMALNPQWRKTLTQWCAQIRYWLERPGTITLRYADIFFDFCHVSGREDLASSLRQFVTGAVQQNHAFLREMQRVQQDHGVALGARGRLAPEQEEGPDKGRIQLKYGGMLPLVEAIRLLALRDGVAETSTLGRIEALFAGGTLARDEQDYLSDAFHTLTALILRQQIKDFKDGRAVSSAVALATLSQREQDRLTDSLRAVRDLRERVRLELTAEIFS